MDITVKGTPDQSFTIPTYDDTEIRLLIADLEKRFKKFEGSVPVPAPFPKRLFSDTSCWNAQTVFTPMQNSSTIVAELVRQSAFLPNTSPNINSVGNSVALYRVTSNIPKVKVNLPPYGLIDFRVPPNVGIAPGGDFHFAIYDEIDDDYIEGWMGKFVNGQLTCAWGGRIQNVKKSNGVVPAIGALLPGARATSLPLAGGLILLDELKAGVIPHALAFAVREGKALPAKPPALRTDTGVPFYPSGLQAGQKFRFPLGFVPPVSVCPMIKMMIRAVTDYGMYLVDRAGATSFYAEDTSRFGQGDQIAQFYGGKQYGFEVMLQFPFTALKAVA